MGYQGAAGHRPDHIVNALVQEVAPGRRDPRVNNVDSRYLPIHQEPHGTFCAYAHQNSPDSLGGKPKAGGLALFTIQA